MSKWGEPLIFSIPGTGMEKRLFPSLSIEHLTHLTCKIASFPPVLLSSHLSLEEETLVVSEVPCRSPSWHPWWSRVLSLGICPGGLSSYRSKVPEARHSILLRSCQHLVEQEGCFICFSGWTFIYTSHGDVCLSHESMILPIMPEPVIPHHLQSLSWRSAVCSVVPCSVHLQPIVPKYSNVYLSLLNRSRTISLLCWDLFDCKSQLST